MRVIRWFLLLAFVAFTASVAMADGVDPKFKLKGGGGSQAITDGTFNFLITPTSPIVDGEFQKAFVNRSFDAQSLVLTIFGLPTSLQYTCDPSAGGNFFTNCTFIRHEDLTTTISFFGTDETHPGILTEHCAGDADADDSCTGPPQAHFILDVTGIPSNFTVISVSGALPEPATGFSLLIGLIGLAAWQKLRRATA